MRRCRGPFQSRRWNQAFGLLCVVCLAMLVREFSKPVTYFQPTRWIRKDGPPLSRKERAKIKCPRWDGSPTSPVTHTPKGPWKPPGRHSTSFLKKKKFSVYLYAVVASTESSRSSLSHFLKYYLDLGIPADHMTVTVQSTTMQNDYKDQIVRELDARDVHYDEWIGTFSSATKAWHREEVIANAKHIAPDDWIVVADVDEFHQFPTTTTTTRAPPESSAPPPPPRGVVLHEFLKAVEKTGANYVLSKFEDRVSKDGSLLKIRPDVPLEEQFPLRCDMTEWTKPPEGSAARFFLPRAEDTKIAAFKASIRVHRSAHKVAWRAVWRSMAGLAPWPRRYQEGLLTTRHYKWVHGLAAYLARRVETYETCGMLWAYESASINAHLAANDGKVCVTCGELACARAAGEPGGSLPTTTRIAVVTSVWDEHVDGVSITMNRVARFLKKNDHLFDVLVVTPHDPSVPEPVVDVREVPKLASSSAPIFALVGRHDYVVGLPLGPSQKKALDFYDPDVYHLVSPDALGYSAQAYAKKTNKCTVCSYHTQLDRYVRFYAQKHGFLDKFKPRLLIQRLFGNFYSGCDVVAVPNEAIADKLVSKMAIPRHKIGFFPRGVNRTQYTPTRRNATWRAAVAGCASSANDVVVLWAARLVKEKGADLFAASLAHFFKNAPAAQTSRVRVVVVGDGPERDAMRAALPLDRTTFLLHLSGVDLWRAYASSDVYFFPSHTEAFPNTLLEAQASGLAVLAPAYSVNRALVPTDAGYLVDEHAGPKDFADGLLQLVTNETRRATIAHRAVEVASMRTWDAAFGELQHCYDRCLRKNIRRQQTPSSRRAGGLRRH